jgi:hypothetical protein
MDRKKFKDEVFYFADNIIEMCIKNNYIAIFEIDELRQGIYIAIDNNYNTNVIDYNNLNRTFKIYSVEEFANNYNWN